MDRIRTLAAALRTALVEFEPGTCGPELAANLAEELAATENACGVAKARLAAHAAACGAHQRRGHADVRDWLASMGGSTVRIAGEALETIEAVEACPDTRAALVKGEVSLGQAGEIARAERDAPGGEGELLVKARGGSLGVVRIAARKRRLEAIEREELHRRQVAAREFRHWVDDVGMVCGAFRLPPVAGVALVAAGPRRDLRPLEDQSRPLVGSADLGRPGQLPCRHDVAAVSGCVVPPCSHLGGWTRPACSETSPTHQDANAESLRARGFSTEGRRSPELGVGARAEDRRDR